MGFTLRIGDVVRNDDSIVATWVDGESSLELAFCDDGSIHYKVVHCSNKPEDEFCRYDRRTGVISTCRTENF